MEIELAFLSCQKEPHLNKCAVFCSSLLILFAITKNTQIGHNIMITYIQQYSDKHLALLLFKLKTGQSRTDRGLC